MDDDNQAIGRLKQGDIGGLEILVNRYQVQAMRAAFLILRNEQAAEDVVQETFVRIFDHIQSFEQNRPFGPYLLRSVVNAALDASKKEAYYEALPDGLEAAESLIQQVLTVEAQAELSVLKRELDQALKTLSPRQRAVIVMRYYLEMSEKEMAASLEIAPGTIKWLLNIARERLRSLLMEGSGR